MDDVRASLPPLKTVVPLPLAKATLKHSLNTGLVGANLGEMKVDSEINLSDTDLFFGGLTFPFWLRMEFTSF